MTMEVCEKRSYMHYCVAGIVLSVLVYLLPIRLNVRYLGTGEDRSLRDLVPRALPSPDNDYMIIPNVATPDDDSSATASEFDTVICTQTFVNFMHHVTPLSKRWKGELSIAVYSYGEEIARTYQYIMLLRECSIYVKSNVRFHLVYPTAFPPVTLGIEKHFTNDCDQVERLTQEFRKHNFTELGITYPINLLRNVAIVYSNSPYIFNIDIDFLPSKGLKNDMAKYLYETARDTDKKKHAFVIPCFESNASRALDTKSQLLGAIRHGSVRQHTFQRCPQCHRPTNYSLWTALPVKDGLKIAYYVKHHYAYEPFYIAHRKSMPFFDGRFVYFGFDRVSQVCEAFTSGLKFGVLNKAFIVHDGFKTVAQHYKWKEDQNKINGEIFRTEFRDTLQRRYPNGSGLCKMEQEEDTTKD